MARKIMYLHRNDIPEEWFGKKGKKIMKCRHKWRLLHKGIQRMRPPHHKLWVQEIMERCPKCGLGRSEFYYQAWIPFGINFISPIYEDRERILEI